MADYFPSATDARTSSRNNIIIFNEVTAIQRAILSASNLGSYSCTVTGTTMTSASTGTPYFDTWQGVDESNSFDPSALDDQMTQVMSYFTGLSYSISRVQNTTTTNTFNWSVQW